MKFFKHLSLPFFLLAVLSAKAQLIPEKQHDRLFTAGFANAFIGGLYDGFYPYSKLKQNGNFGLGAPDKLDGELAVLDGKLYKTQYTGKTFQVNDSELTPYAVVNFFRADKTVSVKNPLNKQALFSFLDSTLNDKNGLYAIHIKGNFKTVRTRAFPPAEKPYIPLADMLDKQHFFDYTAVKGDFIGYYIPSYMEGANITSYHFHFLNAARDAGGHVIDLLTDGITIEIDQLNSFAVDMPQTKEFKEFDFNKDRSAEVKSVETGKKH